VPERELRAGYSLNDDRLVAVGSGGVPETRVTDGGWLTIRLSADGDPVGFEIENFRFFVDFYVLAEVFGPSVVEPLADFQAEVVEHHRSSGDAELPWVGRPGAIEKLERAGRLQPA